MDPVNMREARRRFSDLVSAAERGESTDITKRGRLVARVEPVVAVTRRKLPNLSKFRASIQIKGKPVSQVVLDSRKEARY